MMSDTSIYIYLEYVSQCRTSERLLFISSNTEEHPKVGTSYVSQCRSSERLLFITERLLFIISNTEEHPKGGTSYTCLHRIQGGEDSQDPLSLQVIFRTRALYSVALLWKMICNLGDPMSLRHPVRQFDVCMLFDSMDVYIAEFSTMYTCMSTQDISI